MNLRELELAVGKLSEMHDAFTAEERKINIGGTGITKDKRIVRTILVDLALTVSKAMVAFGKNTGKKQGLKQVYYSFSDLHRASDEKLVSLCTVLVTKAKAIKVLPDYGITKVMLSRLEEQTRAFKNVIPLNAINKHSNAACHALMKEILREMCDLLKYSIDNMMAVTKYEPGNKYEVYKFLRKEVCVGRKRKAKLKKVVNQQTGEVLTDVKVDIIHQAEMLVTDFINEQQHEDAFKATIKIEKKGFKPLIIEKADLRMLELIEAALVPEENEELKINKEQLIMCETIQNAEWQMEKL